MTSEQVTLSELLEDPLYKKWFLRAPLLSESIVQKPWRVYVLLEGRWRFRDFKKYPKASKWLVEHLEKFDDAALACKFKQFQPPVVKSGSARRHYIPGVPGQSADHHWCGFCRRPTLMAYFSKHHALKHCLVWVKRCTICGYREEHLKRW